MTILNARVRSTVHASDEGEVIAVHDGPGYSDPLGLRIVYVVLWDSGNTSYLHKDDFLPIEDEEEYEDTEPFQSHDLSDDADALASAGMGTDEDYGCYGYDEY